MLVEKNNKIDLTHFYESQISTYDEIDGYAHWEIIYKEYKNWIKKHHNLSSNSNIELGCGTGLLSKMITDKGLDLCTIDLSNKFLKISQQRCNSEKFIPLQCDLEHLPLKDKSFDTVLCFGVLDQIKNLDGVISEIQRICKPNAFFLFDFCPSCTMDFWYCVGVYGLNGLKSWLKSFFQKRTEFEWTILDDNFKKSKICVYKSKSGYFESLLKSSGFRIMEKKGLHIFTMLIPEKIQVDSNSKLLSKIILFLHKLDAMANHFVFFQNRSSYLLYFCQLQNHTENT